MQTFFQWAAESSTQRLTSLHRRVAQRLRPPPPHGMAAFTFHDHWMHTWNRLLFAWKHHRVIGAIGLLYGLFLLFMQHQSPLPITAHFQAQPVASPPPVFSPSRQVAEEAQEMAHIPPQDQPPLHELMTSVFRPHLQPQPFSEAAPLPAKPRAQRVN